MEYVLDYETRETTDREGKPCFHAWLTAQPSVLSEGYTEHEALTALLYQAALASWRRQFNPDCPGLAQGMWAEPIQQCIDLLSETLRSASSDRMGIMLRGINEPHNVARDDTSEKARLSELIGNLGTAIAALARVKHD